MKLVYRQVDDANPEVKRTLQRLQKACLPYDTVYFPPDGVWWLVYDKTEPVAFGCVTPSQQDPEGAYLGRSGVLPSHRGHGIQRELIRKRCRWAKSHGYKHAYSDTTDNNPSANNMIKSGFLLHTPKVLYSFARALYWKKTLCRIKTRP